MRYDRVAVQETSPSQDHGPLVYPRGAAEDGEHEERNRLAHRLGRTDDQVDRVQARVSGTPPRPRAQTSSTRSHRVTRLSAPTATRAPAATRRHGLVPGRTGSTDLDAGRRQLDDPPPACDDERVYGATRQQLPALVGNLADDIGTALLVGPGRASGSPRRPVGAHPRGHPHRMPTDRPVPHISLRRVFRRWSAGAWM